MKNYIVNNKQIALFMGAKTHDKSIIKMNKNQIWIPGHGVRKTDTIELGAGSIMKYHKSWDWLIPVIDKITSHDNYPKYVENNSNGIAHKGDLQINTKSIEATYNNVVDFMHWLVELK